MFIQFLTVAFDFTGNHEIILTLIISVPVDHMIPPWDSIGFQELGNIIL